MPIWNPQAETMSRDALKELQLNKLKILCSYLYENVKFYRDKFDEMKLKPSDMKTIEDIKKFPITTKK